MLNKYFFLAVTKDFVNYTKVKYIKTFFVFSTVKSYSRKVQFNILFSVLQDYSIVQKLEAVVSDNSSTNNIFCQAIEVYFLKKEDIK